MVIAVPISAATACAIGTTFSPSSRTIVALISNPISRPKVGSTVTAAVITAPHTVIELPPPIWRAPDLALWLSCFLFQCRCVVSFGNLRYLLVRSRSSGNAGRPSTSLARSARSVEGSDTACGGSRRTWKGFSKQEARWFCALSAVGSRHRHWHPRPAVSFAWRRIRHG